VQQFSSFRTIQLIFSSNSLAYGEMRLIVSKLIWNFDMELQQESQNWSNQLTYNLWSKGELNVKLTPVERLGA
jgi:hypothetical protein